jgi:ribosomal protein S18 acetylase RimI-like enzyme
VAARHQFAQELEVVDLRRAGAWELDPLLLAQTLEWRQALDWDYGKSADLVRKYISTGSLAGAALVTQGTVVGYGYTVVEDGKGLIGDLYVQPHLRGTAAEQSLFHALVKDVLNSPVRRIESQLLLVDHRTAVKAANEAGFRTYERTLMTSDARPGKASKPGGFRMEEWGDHRIEAAATVITLAYRGHVDSEVNDQYRTFGAATRFLRNLIDFPGCGTFFPQGSVVAFDRSNGRPVGIALSSFVAADVGHVTQLCVTPDAQGKGLGLQLLWAAMSRLYAAGAKRIGLTVTLSNVAAVRLYELCGFREVRRFFAYAKEL